MLTAALLLLPGLNGCLVHSYSVQKAQMPTIVRDAAAEQLVKLVNDENHRVRSLKATVGIQLSVGGTRKGKVTDYTTLSGYILLRSPELLRVLGMLPVVHTSAFDLASDGKNFTLVVAPKSRAYTGSNAVTRPSENPLENLRPNIFFDTMILREIAPDDLVFVTKETKTYVDPKSHQLKAQLEYDLTVVRHKVNSQELIPERCIHFDRSTLLPSGVDIYNGDGNIQTIATYGPYASYGDERFPATITIRRPIDEYQILLSIQKLTLNQQLADNQFELKIPEGYTVKKMD